jgi:hypothetical protein
MEILMCEFLIFDWEEEWGNEEMDTMRKCELTIKW